ncbi:arsenic resistance N-acetyltransferase ArsN2 [Pendulispora albinea]|uniref:Arsenic resistance N-acetyltransferase ArsN2 n=1 Tax=Pendulispora albinea TaxID=2741071 RepID=A0ABZ2MAK5_9BACT
MELAPAHETDLPEVERLLIAAGLPLDGLRDQFPTGYVLAKGDDGALVGVAGLEAYGDAGLLRSVAVVDAARSAGIGGALVTERLEHAAGRGMREVFLLTTTAADYFRKRGFRETTRASAPAALAASPEFAGACPASATCLVWQVNRP